ncbi:MAG: DUF4145 domain-containing protein, partial [Chthonomonadaceae bacterium]|nr:DUF4145 domain-containing protein [Chthonomonadaceae bacterium]
MSHDYVPPVHRANAFNCPHCNAFAQQSWNFVLIEQIKTLVGSQQVYHSDITACRCEVCRKFSLWDRASFVYPRTLIAPIASEDMPEDVAKEYEEARLVYALSPKASTALLRLALQRLCQHLGEPGKDINADIGALVKKGLPPAVQKAMDIVRVVGNEAVHPGTMDINDTPQIALRLFNLVNMVVHDMITRPKEL